MALSWPHINVVLLLIWLNSSHILIRKKQKETNKYLVSKNNTIILTTSGPANNETWTLPPNMNSLMPFTKLYFIPYFRYADG